MCMKLEKRIIVYDDYNLLPLQIRITSFLN